MRHALRGLAKHPGFATVAILSLALGIGANTAIFSLVNAVMLKSLPVSHPEELVQVTSGRVPGAFTNPMWEHFNASQDVFSGVFAWGHIGLNLTEGGEARRAHGRWSSGDFFTTLGVRAAQGRTILPSDDRRGCPGVAVLSDAFWRREYGGDPGAVGRNISLDGHSFAILGVLDPAFTGVEVGEPGEIFLPLCSEAIINGQNSGLDQRTRWWLYAMGRPKPGMSIERARARLRMLAPAIMSATLPANYVAEEERKYLERTFDLLPMPGGLSGVRRIYSESLLILIAATGLVLLIACSNIANLLLARAAMRRQEVAVRMALGAGRGHILRQALTESLLLSFAGTALGACFAIGAAKLLVSTLGSPDNPVLLDLAPDWRMLAFTAAVAVVAALIFGLGPAWRLASVPPIIAMKARGRGVTEGPSRLRTGNALVALQIALSFVLLAGAGLLGGSFRHLATLDPGFRSEGVMLMTFEFPASRYAPSQYVASRREILERLRHIAGIRSVSSSYLTPIGNGDLGQDLITSSGQEIHAHFNVVSDGFFETLGTPVLSGRDFTPRDNAGSPPVAIINETAAAKFFPGVNPLGERIRLREGKNFGAATEIIGVVRDAKYLRLSSPISPTVYVSLDQDTHAHGSIVYELRGDGAATTIAQAKSVIAGFDARIPLVFLPFSRQVSESLSRERLLAALSSVFGGLALLLSCVGLYGVLSYNVAQRRNEIGIRMALGATRAVILRMVVRESSLLTAAGLAIGVLGALAAGRLVATVLYGVSPNDAATLAGAALVLTMVTTVAAYLPARRAATVDPMVALRDE